MKQLILLALLFAAVVFVMLQKGNVIESRNSMMKLEALAEKQMTRITLLSSDEKADWIRWAASEFAKLRPDIQLKVEVMSSMESVRSIFSGERLPTLWSPADFIVLEYLNYKWSEEHGESLYLKEGEDAPQSLASSPLVWLSWRRQVGAMEAAMATKSIPPGGEWAAIGCAGIPTDEDDEVVPENNRWARLPQMKSLQTLEPFTNMDAWGQVKFFYTDPTASNSGFQTIYMMANAYLNPVGDISASFLEERNFTAWFRRCQVSRDDYVTSTSALTWDFLQFGSSKFDVVVTYENLALMMATQEQEREPNLEKPYIYYPKKTVWSRHPIVILQGDELTSDQAAAARDWIAFLLAPAQQARLVQFGLRPARRDISIREIRRDNPFLEQAHLNVQIEPQSKEVSLLSGEFTDALMEKWRRVTGRY